MRLHAILSGPTARAEMGRLWDAVRPLLDTREFVVEVRTKTRSTAQNALLWSILGDIASQVEWHSQKLDAEAWKDMATAALKRQRVVPGLDGGFVVLGQRTSAMTVAEMSELIEFLYALGAQHGVRWSRTSLGREVPNEIAA